MSTPASSRRWMPVALALALVAVAVGQALAIVTAGPSGAPVILRLSLEEGDRYRYRMELSMDGRISAGQVRQRAEFLTTTLLQWRVEEVDDSGIATIAVRSTTLSATVNGRPVSAGELPDREDLMMRVAPDGRVLEADPGLSSQPGAPVPAPGVNQFLPTFPPTAVAPGDTWDAAYTQRFDEQEAGVEIVTESEFERYEEIHGIEAALIRTAVRIPLDLTLAADALRDPGGETAGEGLPAAGAVALDGSARMEGRSWFHPGRGIPLRSEVDGHLELAFTLEDEAAGPGPDAPRIAMDFDVGLTMDLARDGA